MNIKRIVIGFAEFCLCVIAAEPLTACKELTPDQEKLLTKASAAILCAMEGEMMDDPALNKACEEILPQLAPAQRSSVEAHIAARKARAAHSLNDAGISQEAGK